MVHIIKLKTKSCSEKYKITLYISNSIKKIKTVIVLTRQICNIIVMCI